MYRILIITARSDELNPIKPIIRNANISNLKIDFFTTGMGNYKTILHLTELLSKKTYDFIINIGSCGFVKIHNPDTLFFQICQIFNIQNEKELLPPVSIKVGDFANIFCSEKPIYNLDQLPENIFGNNILCDMESYGIEVVCDFFKIPRLILKVPIDKIGEKFYSNIFLEKIKKVNYKNILIQVLEFLQTVPQETDLTKYNDFFRFSVSQQYIFKKLYFRYVALVGEDFDIFFNENKNLDKKQFLEKLSNVE